MQRDVTTPKKPPRTKAALARIGGLVLLVVVASIVGYKLGWFDYIHTVEHVRRLRQAHSFAAFAVGFIIVFGLGSSVGLPALPFTVAAGVIFGTLLGSALAWIGALVGATSGYFIARTVGHNVVLRWVKRFKQIDRAVGESRDFTGMLRLRLLPVIPLGMVNFVGGLAKAPFAPYFAATAVGIIPSTFIYSYFAGSILERAGTGRQKALVSLVISSVLLILLTLAPRFLRMRETRTEDDGAGPAAPSTRHKPATTQAT